jgi:hypothetical protein
MGNDGEKARAVAAPQAIDDAERFGEPALAAEEDARVIFREGLKPRIRGRPFTGRFPREGFDDAPRDLAFLRCKPVRRCETQQRVGVRSGLGKRGLPPLVGSDAVDAGVDEDFLAAPAASGHIRTKGFRYEVILGRMTDEQLRQILSLSRNGPALEYGPACKKWLL